MSQCCTDCCNNATCDTAQNYCKFEQTAENNFSFLSTNCNNTACINSGELIAPGFFDIDSWNSAINKINNVYSEGSAGKPASISNYVATTEAEKFISASEFLRVCRGLLNDSSGRNTKFYSDFPDLKDDLDNNLIATNKVIYGTYFQHLRDAIKNIKYGYDQCDACNTGCDGCDSECGDCGDCCDSEDEEG